MIVSLDGVKWAKYRVTTASGSVYDLDLDDGSFTRLPAMDMAMNRYLRRDGEKVDVLTLVRCRVGQPAVLIIDLHWPGVPATLRQTTDVADIRPLATPTPHHVATSIRRSQDQTPATGDGAGGR